MQAAGHQRKELELMALLEENMKLRKEIQQESLRVYDYQINQQTALSNNLEDEVAAKKNCLLQLESDIQSLKKDRHSKSS